jgi:hypothetical protein
MARPELLKKRNIARMHIGTSSCLFGSSTVPAVGSDSRYIGAIIWSGLHSNYFRVAFRLHANRIRIVGVMARLVSRLVSRGLPLIGR